MEITWKITQCDSLTSDGYITTAHWTATAVDETYTASIYSTCSFGEGTPSIPYASVTEQEVLNWCWANGVDKDATEAALAAQIELQKNPVQQTGLPWN
jgi:hypothetical protein